MSDNYNNESENWDFLPANGKENPFAIPDSYFEFLSDRVIAKIELHNELAAFHELSHISKKIMFEVPQDYFATNEDKLEYKFEMSAYKELEKIKAQVRKADYQEYFETINQQLLNRIEVTDELKEYKLLKAINKENNFIVDPQYFEDIADRVKERRYAEINQSSWIERLLSFVLKPQVALAYSVIFILAIGLTLYYNNTGQKVVSGDCKTLACLEKNELLNEQNMRDFDVENLYDEVDVDLLDKQISGEDDSNGSDESNSDSIIKKQDSINDDM